MRFMSKNNQINAIFNERNGGNKYERNDKNRKKRN